MSDEYVPQRDRVSIGALIPASAKALLEEFVDTKGISINSWAEAHIADLAQAIEANGGSMKGVKEDVVELARGFDAARRKRRRGPHAA